MKTWRDIDGLTPDADIETYQQLAEKVPAGSVIVELGCFHGKSMASLAEIIQRKNLHPVAVDLWDAGSKNFPPEMAGFFKDMLQQFIVNTNDVGLNPFIYEGPSEQAILAYKQRDNLAWPQLVYIDADHSYEWVKRDIEAWWPLIPSGGILAGHDYGNENFGVKQAVDEFTIGKQLKLERNNGWVWWVVKP